MSVETAFRALLAAYSPLTAVVGTRIAANAAAKDATFPLVVFASTHTPIHGLNNTLLGEQCSVQVQCWGDTAAQADQVADLVTAAVATASANIGATVTSRSTTFDPDTGNDGTTLSVEWWT